MSAAEKQYMGIVASIGCVICREETGDYVACEVHHIAEGSGKRSAYATVGLCPEHHRGSIGLHGRGVKSFCAAYRVPWENEYGLMLWVNKWRAKLGL